MTTHALKNELRPDVVLDPEEQTRANAACVLLGGIAARNMRLDPSIATTRFAGVVVDLDSDDGAELDVRIAVEVRKR